MISFGQRFQLADLQAIATQANGLSASNFDLTNFYASNNAGGQSMTNVAIDPSNSGVNYATNDLVSLGYGSSFLIEAVDHSGAVLAIRVINPGIGSGSDPNPITSTLVTGGSGSGLHLTADFALIPANTNYSFPDFAIITGTITGLFPVSGHAGSGYNSGDTLYPPDLGPSCVITVTTTGAGGSVTAITFSGYTGAIPSDYTNLPTTTSTGSGLGLQLKALVTFPQRPSWLTELNRLRNAIYNLPGLGNNPAFDSGLLGAVRCVSGPWPVGGPTANFLNTNFYFPDAGSSCTITVGSSFPNAPGSVGKFTTMVNKVFDPIQTSGPDKEQWSWVYRVWPFVTTQQFAFIIGGQTNLAVSGTFAIVIGWQRGGINSRSTDFTPDSVDPRTLVTVNQSPGGGYNAFPGTVSMAVTYEADYPSFGSYLTISIAVNQTLAPGRYELELDFANPGDDTDITDPSNPSLTASQIYTRIIQTPVEDGVGDPMFVSGSGVMQATVTTSTTFSTAVAVPGIHNSLPIKKINLPGDAFGNGPGIYCVYVQWNQNNWYTPTDTPNGSYPSTLPDQTVTYPTAVTFGPEYFFSSGLSFSESVAGFWTAMCEAVGSLNIATGADMPWNLTRTKYGSAGNATVNPMLIGDQAPNIGNVAQVSNSYAQTTIVEKQSEPPGWAASTYFTTGFVIQDSNGNIQQCGASGVSGSSAPTWATEVGSGTTDNGVTWTMIAQCAAAAAPWSASANYTAGQSVLDSNGNTQVCLAPGGTSGGTHPAWPSVPGTKTKDGTVVWEMALLYLAATHRIPDLPRYPDYMQGEMLADLLPPATIGSKTIWGAYNQWFYNVYDAPNYDQGWHQLAAADTGFKGMAYGWWIYSVSINRQSYNTAAIAVTIGCIRSGNFVAFGTYNTGQTIQVLWPIFTSDTLVYQATERLDIQALAIATSNTVSSSPTVTDPALVAAFATDTTALLNLVT